MTKKELRKLIDNYLNGQASPAERAWLEDWYASFEVTKPDWDKQKRKYVRNDIYQSLTERVLSTAENAVPVKKMRPMWSRLLPYVAALLLVVGGTYTLIHSWSASTVKKPEEHRAIQLDTKVPDRPVLVLDDGRMFTLDTLFGSLYVDRGSIRNEHGDTILGAEQLRKTNNITLLIPHHSQYTLTLSDGSRIWLDAASRVSCPLSFTDSLRVVEATGQLYFTVSKQPHRPFLVRTPREEVRVLGTEFVLHHYRGDKQSYVALVEGAVKVNIPHHNAAVLKPNQMVHITERQVAVKTAPIDELVAWKNDEFVFNDRPIGEVMQEISRWYGIEYEIAPGIQQLSVWGTMSRKEKLETNLENIQRISSGIQFKVNEGRVFVMK